MTKFIFKGDGTWGAGDGARSFAYAMDSFEGFEAYLKRATKVLERSEAILETTLTHLNNGPRKRTAEVAHRYFRTNLKGLAGKDLDVIKKRLRKTRNGLTNGTLGLKVHAGTSVETDRDAVGKVKWRSRIPDGKIYPEPKPSRKPVAPQYHTSVVPLKTWGVWRAGAIHITRDGLDHDVLACKTIIHEATHKYIGTDDYCYFNHDGSNSEAGFFLDDSARLLCNADSYAWFAVIMHRHITNGDSMD